MPEAPAVYVEELLLTPQGVLSGGRDTGTFLPNPQAPRGVKLAGYLISGPTGGTLPKDFRLISPSQAELPD